jgi:Fic family protein
MSASMTALESFVNGATAPILVAAGLAHAQFETIHPFLDGNGRTGRLLIGLMLHERSVLSKPVLYLSTHLKRHQAAYFNHLTAVRTVGDWEGWLRFFLQGVHAAAASAASTAETIHRLRESDRENVIAAGGVSYDLALLDRLFSQPLTNSSWVERELGVSTTTANKALDRLCTSGVLRETTGNKRNRVYRYDTYVDLFGVSEAVERDQTHG